MNANNWHEIADRYRPLVDTGRKRIELKKYPEDLDFTKTVGGTTYVVKSHFNPQARESLLRIVCRRMDSEYP
jgi:hypothetical protein